MRTTLDIDDDVLLAVKERAKAGGSTAGRVLSDLARTAMQPDDDPGEGEFNEVLGFAPLPSRGVVVTNEMIDAIREAEGI